MLTPTEKGHRLVDIASDLQAVDIVLLDLRDLSSFADYFVILTATSSRQARALREDMVKRFKDSGVPLSHVEGISGSGWQLLDFGDVVVHIFGEAEREFYRLEDLWSRANQVVRVQ